MKRYLAFGNDCYYPAGGWDDFRGDFDNVTEAFEAAKRNNEKYGWWHVIDRDTMNEVEEITLEASQ